MNLKDLLVLGEATVLLVNEPHQARALGELLDLPEETFPSSAVVDYTVLTPQGRDVTVIDITAVVKYNGVMNFPGINKYLKEMNRARTKIQEYLLNDKRKTTVIVIPWTKDPLGIAGISTWFTKAIFIAKYSCVIEDDYRTFRVIRRPNGEAVDNTAYPLLGTSL